MRLPMDHTVIASSMETATTMTTDVTVGDNVTTETGKSEAEIALDQGLSISHTLYTTMLTKTSENVNTATRVTATAADGIR